jgi:hypothetical protein
MIPASELQSNKHYYYIYCKDISNKNRKLALTKLKNYAIDLQEEVEDDNEIDDIEIHEEDN